jgi:LmbE family N-acetylglucosaminyl deacetylase
MLSAVERPTAAELLDRLCAAENDPRPAPRTLIVAAHADDEVIGAGARLGRLRDATIVHVTDGAPKDGRDAKEHGLASVEEYAQARRKELEKALELVGIGPERLLELNCPDQQASHRLVELTRRLEALFLEKRPEVVLTQPYEGGHPDHDATAFSVHAACQVIRDRGADAPVVVEMTSYHRGGSGLASGEFLNSDGEVVTRTLSSAELALKRTMLSRYVTQQETLRYFQPGTERFRIAPKYDFSCPPHDGRLFYEDFMWGMSGAEFCKLAEAAMERLNIKGAI